MRRKERDVEEARRGVASAESDVGVGGAWLMRAAAGKRELAGRREKQGGIW